jgi:hypothetical protein
LLVRCWGHTIAVQRAATTRISKERERVS